MKNSNTKNKSGARPDYQMQPMSTPDSAKNLNRAEPRIGLALGMDKKLYHKMRGNQGKANRMGIIGY